MCPSKTDSLKLRLGAGGTEAINLANIRAEVRALINQRRKLQFLRDSTQQAMGMIRRLEQDLEQKLRTKQ